MDKEYQVTKKESFLKINCKTKPQASLHVLGAIVVKRIDASSEKFWDKIQKLLSKYLLIQKYSEKKLLSADTEHDQILFVWYKLPSI